MIKIFKNHKNHLFIKMKKQKIIKIESLKKNEIRKCLRRVRKSKENSHVQKAF